MKEGCCIFSKTKLDIKKLIKDANIDEDKVLIINDADDWCKRKNETIAIEYNGLLNEEDHDKYAGYYYYDIMAESKEEVNKIKKLNYENAIIE